MGKTYVLKELVVEAENKAGMLHSIAESIGKKGINIENIVAYGVGKTAIFRIVTADNSSAKKAMRSVEGVNNIYEDDIVVIKLENKPNQLSKITKKLTQNGVNIECIYILSKNSKTTEVAIKPEQAVLEKTLAVLEGKE